MKQAIIISLVALLLNPAGITAQAQAPAAERAKDFATAYDAYINKTLEKIPDIPAVAVVVIKDDKPIFIRAYGMADREAGVKADTDTLFYIASGTKAFTALAASMLDREGKIRFADPAVRYVSATKFKNQVPETITVRDLLTHTSGLRNDALVNRLAVTGQIDPDDLARVFAEGTTFNENLFGKYRYNNFGYNFYGMILEDHLKTKWQDLLQKRVFDPMGLKHTTAYVSKARPKKWTVAVPYVYDEISGKVIRSVLEKKDNNMQSAGGLFTSISDIGRWLNMNMNGGKLGGKQVMPADLIRAALTGYTDTTRNDPPFTSDGQYGLGWQIGQYRNEKVIYHHGGFTGYSSHFSFFPEKKVAVAVVTNIEPVGQRAAHMIATYALDHWLGVENLDAEYDKQLLALVDLYQRRKEQSHASAIGRSKRSWTLSKPFADYAGKYGHDLYGTMEVTALENALAIRFGNMSTVATPFTEKDTIRVVMLPGGNGEVIGFKEDGGKFVSLNYSGVIFTRMR